MKFIPALPAKLKAVRTADKLWNALSLCKKAGKLIAGFDAVCESLQMGEAKLLLFAGDVSPKTQQKATEQNANGATVCVLPYMQQQIAIITNKPVGVLAVADKDLAALCLGAFTKDAPPPHKEEPV